MRLNPLQIVELSAVSLAGLSSFVETHIWTPAYTYYLLLVLVVLDVLTNNLVQNKPLRPRNLAARLVGYTVILSLAHGFGEHEKGLFFLTQLVLAPFVLVHMRRLIISLGKLDLVDSDVADLLSRRISRQAEREPDLSPEAEPTPTVGAEAAPEPVATPA